MNGTPTPEQKEALVVSLCEWISQGLPLREWSRQPGNVSHVTVMNWGNRDPDIKARIAVARANGADVLAEEILAIADRDDDNGGAVARDRLRVDSRMWLLERWSGKYSSKRTVELTGAEGGPLTMVRRVIVDADK